MTVAWPAVTVHPSQFPEVVDQEVLQSLQARIISGKLHYQSYLQAARWTRIHESFAPTDSVDEVFTALLERLETHRWPKNLEVFSLGCGQGEKDVRVVQGLRQHAESVRYVACDASLSLVLSAMNRMQATLPSVLTRGLVADVVRATDLDTFGDPESARLFLFLGMMPNVSGQMMLQRLKGWMRPNDHLWVSANLAPGDDYRAGCQAILPQYDNPPTRAWLETFLEGLGLKDSGALTFHIEPVPETPNLLRIAANFQFHQAASTELLGEAIRFSPNDNLELFGSTRHTPSLLEKLLAEAGLSIQDRARANNGEEGLWWVSG